VCWTQNTTPNEGWGNYVTQTAPAGWYPDPENPAQQRYWDGVAWTQNAAPSLPSEYGPQDLADPESALQPVADASVIRTWKTSVGFSILGWFLAPLLLPLLSGLLAIVPMILAGLLTGSDALNGSLVAVAGYVLVIVYAAKFYPSYFTDKPLLRSSRAISFANVLFGGWIGLIWNGNLTKRTKGFSYVVVVVAGAIMLPLLAFGLYSPSDTSGDSSSDTFPPTVENPTPTASQEPWDVEPLERTADAIIYTDPETGASFVIPEAWSVQPFSVAEQGRQAKLRIPGDGGTAFYTSVILSPEEPRRSMDDWSDEDIYALAEPNASDLTVQRITLNDVEYFVTTARELSSDNINVFHIVDGRIYGFQYVEVGSGVDDAALRTFYSMVASTVYPAPSQTGAWEPWDIEPLERTDDASVYTDTETGASFVIPDGWSGQPQQGRDDDIKAALYPDGFVEWSSWITYARADNWTGPAEMEAYSPEDFLELRSDDGFGYSSADRVSINGIPYFLTEGTQTITQNGEGIEVHGAVLSRTEGEHLYQFMYYTSKNSSVEDAIGSSGGDWQTFCSMVASMVYP